MFRIALACLALALFSSDALAGHRRPLFRARERIVHRERYVKRGPVLPRTVIVPRVLVPRVLLPMPSGAGCGAAGCAVPAKK